MESERKNEIVAYNNTYYDYPKSNFLISAVYKSTLYENKLMAMGLHSIASGQAEITPEGYMIARFSHAQIKRLFNVKSSGLYDVLKESARRMINRPIFMEDEIDKRFKYINAVIDAQYEDGIFSIRFHKDLKPMIAEIKENFTMLNLEMMASFKSVYSFRLYELLKSKAYDPKKSNPRSGSFEIHYQLAELKLRIGAVNSDLTKVKRVLEKNDKTPDYEKAVEVADEKTYDSWTNFKNKVLNPKVLEEIAEKTEMTVSYIPLKKGKGGKVHEVLFYVTYKEQNTKKEKIIACSLTDDEKDDFIDEVHGFLDVKLKSKDIRKIAEAAEYDMEKVKKANAAYEAYSANNDVENVVGFYIKAIQEDYDVTKSQKPKKTKSQTFSKKYPAFNSFNQFEQRDYDWDELEKKFLACDARGEKR